MFPDIIICQALRWHIRVSLKQTMPTHAAMTYDIKRKFTLSFVLIFMNMTTCYEIMPLHVFAMLQL